MQKRIVSDFLKISNNENLSQKDFISLAKKFDYVDFINKQLENIVNNKYYIIDNSSYNNFFLGENDFFTLNLTFFKAIIGDDITNQYLYSYEKDFFIVPISNDFELEYNIYEYNTPFNVSILDKQISLKGKRKALKKYECLFVKKNYEILDILHNSNSFIFLQLTSKTSSSYIWEFQKQTLFATRIISADILTNRIQTSIKVLSDIGNLDSVVDLVSLCSNENHTIRWEAINSLINIDYEIGISQLKKMQNDVHPEIRSASFKSLKILKII